MTRTQIQLPEPLFRRLKCIAGERDWSLAELVRRGMEVYVQTCPEMTGSRKKWTMPVLRGSGGHLADPAEMCVEAEAIEKRTTC
ncbi:MAG: antitoxin [Verrucomicrobia bacterium]|nr:antitoxin [Verrucomicrobiota bacterium]